jgi:DnaJ-domain-containing protein 1
MTAVDIVVIAAGLLFGYRLVSNYLSPNTDARPDPLRIDDRRLEGAAGEREANAWFTVLGVPEHAEWAEIERAYCTMIDPYQPDKVARMDDDLRQLAERRAQDIYAAYATARRLHGR